MNIKQATRRISPDLIIQAEKPRRLVKSQRFNASFRPGVPSLIPLLCLSFMSPRSAPRFLRVSREKE